MPCYFYTSMPLVILVSVYNRESSCPSFKAQFKCLFQSFIQQTLRIYKVSGIILGTGDATQNKTQSLLSRCLRSTWEARSKQGDKLK